MNKKQKIVTKSNLYYFSFLPTILAWAFIHIFIFPVFIRHLSAYDLTGKPMEYFYLFPKFIFKYGDLIFYITVFFIITAEIGSSIYKKYKSNILRFILVLYNCILFTGLLCLCLISSFSLDDGLANFKIIDTDKISLKICPDSDTYLPIDSEYPVYSFMVENNGSDIAWIRAVGSDLFEFYIEKYDGTNWIASGIDSFVFTNTKIGLMPGTFLNKFLVMHPKLDGQTI